MGAAINHQSSSNEASQSKLLCLERNFFSEESAFGSLPARGDGWENPGTSYRVHTKAP